MASPSTVPSPRLLLLSMLMLAVTGFALLGLPHRQGPSAPAVVPTGHRAVDPSPKAAAPPLRTPAATPAGSPPAPVTSALPPHGEGVAGDRAIQRSLEAAWPADLPAGDERGLLDAGRALLRADATGVGRARWPTFFAGPSPAVAPAFATAHFRIQAAIARRDGPADRAVVHLVWAGTDRAGTFSDLRLTDVVFTRALTRGTATWNPQPRT